MSRVAVVGSLNIDLVLPVGRLPRPGETVLTTAPARQLLGGKGANQAAAAAAFGAEVSMIGRVGDDEAAQEIRADLASRGIDVSRVLLTPGSRTGHATIAVDADGENLIVVDAGANALLSATDLNQTWPQEVAVLLVQLETPLDSVAAAMRLAASVGARIVLNPAPAASLPAEILKLADVIVPNRAELALLAGSAGEPEASPEATAAFARRLFRTTNVIITLGAEGALVIPASDEAVHIPAPLVDVVDTTGAGDCFCGTLAASLASGADFMSAARRSTAAAALSTTVAGARGRLPSESEAAELAVRLSLEPVERG